MGADDFKTTIYLAKENLLVRIRDIEGFVGLGLTTESEEIKTPALVVLIREENSPVVSHLPKYFQGYKVLRRVVGNITIQEMGDEDDTIDADDFQ